MIDRDTGMDNGVVLLFGRTYWWQRGPEGFVIYPLRLQRLHVVPNRSDDTPIG